MYILVSDNPDRRVELNTRTLYCSDSGTDIRTRVQVTCPVHLLSLNLSIYLSIYQANNLYPSIDLPIYPSTCLSVCPLSHLFDPLSSHLSIASVTILLYFHRSISRLHLLEEVSYTPVGKLKKCYATLYPFLHTILPSRLPGALFSVILYLSVLQLLFRCYILFQAHYVKLYLEARFRLISCSLTYPYFKYPHCKL